MTRHGPDCTQDTTADAMGVLDAQPSGVADAGGSARDSFLPVLLLGKEIECLKQRLEQAFACIRNLNTANRSQEKEITALRQRIEKLGEDTGLEFSEGRIIPRAAAAKLLHRHPRTLKRWEKSKQLHPLFPFPNQVYYRLSEVQTLLESFDSSHSGRGVPGK